MEKIEVNCPYCSAEQAISYIPGVQTLPCSCHNTFVVTIDDDHRLYIFKKEDDYGTIPGSPYSTYPYLIDKLPNMLQNLKWNILGDKSNKIDLVAWKNLGYCQPSCFLALTNGNDYHEAGEVGFTLNEFFSIIGKNHCPIDMSPASGLLLIVSRNQLIDQIFEECKVLEKKSIFKKIYASIGFYDLSNKILYENKPTACGEAVKSIFKNIFY